MRTLYHLLCLVIFVSMKALSAILLLFSILSTDIAVHMMAYSDHETILLDSKSEKENESENEKEGESEKDKEIVDDSIKNLVFETAIDLSEHSFCLAKLNLNHLEIHLPPPDLI